jgi:D-3-phosphoglycerate dehydrogenase
MTYRIFVEGPIHDHGRALLQAREDVTFSVHEKFTPEEMKVGLADADALILRQSPLSADVIEAAKKLRIVSRYGVGYDKVDVAALSARGIPLAVCGDALSASVAEHSLLLMLGISRNIAVMDRATRNGNYALRYSLIGHELLDKTVLLIGLGKIGLETAKRCHAFGMKIIVAGREASRARAAEYGYAFVDDYRSALGEADFISLHLPSQGRTHILGEAEFQAMKPGAYIINTARGSLIDEDAMYRALTEGTLGGAGLDVTTQEPPAPDCPLLSLDNVLFTPHNSALNDETSARVSDVSVRNALDALDGCLDASCIVNRDVL